MKIRKRIIEIAIASLIVLAIAVGAYLNGNSKLTGQAVYELDQNLLNAIEKNIILEFYDNNNNCELDGELYVDDAYLGRTANGEFLLNKSEYDNKFKIDSTLSIVGWTNGCFEEDADLPFYEYWKIKDLSNSFDNNTAIALDTFLNPRNPRYYNEMQGFVRPEEAKSYFDVRLSKFMKGKTLDDMDLIANIPFTYESDTIKFRTEEYWQTPAETLAGRAGDCEDWATATLSLMKVYNPELKCYGALWPTHVSVICYADGLITIYDQDGVKSAVALSKNNQNDSLIAQENEIEVRKMLSDYYDKYGLQPNDRKLNALFDEDEVIAFNDNEEFVDWIVDLSNG